MPERGRVTQRTQARLMQKYEDMLLFISGAIALFFLSWL